MKKTLIIIAVIVFTSCTDVEGTKEALNLRGYTNVRVEGYGWSYGSRYGLKATKFEAISPAGEKVSGCVTKSKLKGVRIHKN